MQIARRSRRPWSDCRWDCVLRFPILRKPASACGETMSWLRNQMMWLMGMCCACRLWIRYDGSVTPRISQARDCERSLRMRQTPRIARSLSSAGASRRAVGSMRATWTLPASSRSRSRRAYGDIPTSIGSRVRPCDFLMVGVQFTHHHQLGGRICAVSSPLCFSLSHPFPASSAQ